MKADISRYYIRRGKERFGIEISFCFNLHLFRHLLRPFLGLQLLKHLKILHSIRIYKEYMCLAIVSGFP